MTNKDHCCGEQQVSQDGVSIPHFLEEAYGRGPDGQPVSGYIITNHDQSVFLSDKQMNCLVGWYDDAVRFWTPGKSETQS